MIAKYNGPIKFTILHHKQNRGLAGARNTGTEASSGEYLFYLDSDDEIKQRLINIIIGRQNKIINEGFSKHVLNYIEKINSGNIKGNKFKNNNNSIYN